MDFKLFFQFASNASRWLLVTPNGFLSTLRILKHLLESPMHPMGTSKKFSQNRFLSLKMHFSSSILFRSSLSRCFAFLRLLTLNCVLRDLPTFGIVIIMFSFNYDFWGSWGCLGTHLGSLEAIWKHFSKNEIFEFFSIFSMQK